VPRQAVDQLGADAEAFKLHSRKANDARPSLVRHDEPHFFSRQTSSSQGFREGAGHGSRRDVGDAHSIEREDQPLVGFLPAAIGQGHRDVLPQMKIKERCVGRLLFRICVKNLEMNRVFPAVNTTEHGGRGQIAEQGG
jgi:hypothetical protein